MQGDANFGPAGADGARTWVGAFAAPRAVVRADRVEDVPEVVHRADQAARDGHWVVLVLGYEAAPACDPVVRVQRRPPGGTPLAWAAVYDAPLSVSDADLSFPRAVDDAVVFDWTPSLDALEFAGRVEAMLAHIAAGDTYQVNLTFPLQASLPDDAAWAWYAAARQRARAPYAAWIDLGTHVVMSLSPELFVERRGTCLVTRPMKGTQARGRWSAEDDAVREALRTSEKARAENVMIVDLLRNDLGRVAEIGSVRVTALCEIEAYPTVWQMTSTIEAEVAPQLPLWNIFEALFPCGSVTGAPKVRTMALIADHEVAPRGVYTGTIGLLRPGGDAIFSVPIRTVVLEKTSGTATLGVGAGITADSVAADEYAECLLKACFASGENDLSCGSRTGSTGCVRGTSRGYARPRRCGPSPATRRDAALDAVAASRVHGCWRVRLDLLPTGEVTCRADVLVAGDGAPWRIALARAPVLRHDRRLFHKTRDRSFYDQARAAQPALDDVVLWNEAGQLTESCVANLVVDLDETRWTPPLDCGLLPGTFRAHLLAAGEIRERVLTRDDLRRATRVWLVNSLRGWIAAEVVDG